MKSKAFERFLAKRPVSMPTPKPVPLPVEKKSLSQAQHFIDLTEDDDEDNQDFVQSMPAYSNRSGKKLKLK